MNFDKQMLKLGFRNITTGGGCTAYSRKTFNGGEILITSANDPMVPTKANEEVTIGFHDENNYGVGELLTKFDNVLKKVVRFQD